MHHVHQLAEVCRLHLVLRCPELHALALEVRILGRGEDDDRQVGELMMAPEPLEEAAKTLSASCRTWAWTTFML